MLILDEYFYSSCFRVSDKKTLEQILTPYIHPTESDPVTRQKWARLRFFPSICQSYFFYHRVGARMIINPAIVAQRQNQDQGLSCWRSVFSVWVLLTLSYSRNLGHHHSWQYWLYRVTLVTDQSCSNWVWHQHIKGIFLLETVGTVSRNVEDHEHTITLSIS